MLVQRPGHGKQANANRFFVASRPKIARPLRPLKSATSEVVTTPHSGYHYDGSKRQFFEGWYWKVTANDGTSFAFIYSLEDPAGVSSKGGVGVQVVGPSDGDYLCHFSSHTSGFWANNRGLELGATFEPGESPAPRKMTPQAEFLHLVKQGFQASATLMQGSITADETGVSGAPLSTVPHCSWDLSIRPMAGWGGSNPDGQKATAGWLSALSVFEPHWQVLMSHGLADGWVQWGGQLYELKGAAAYAEKNWGRGFPSKWHWMQCNSFDGHPGLSVTAVGARRALLLGAESLGEEDVGLIGVTLPGGEFIELVPWNSELWWEVAPWGKWCIRGVGEEYEALLEGEYGQEGTVVRAPTLTQGLTPLLRDTFNGTARLRVWWRGRGRAAAGDKACVNQPMAHNTAGDAPLIDVSTASAALEVGGGPWNSSWCAKAAMKEPFRTLVRAPINVGALARALPGGMRPPGL